MYIQKALHGMPPLAAVCDRLVSNKDNHIHHGWVEERAMKRAVKKGRTDRLLVYALQKSRVELVAVSRASSLVF
jgi:hypothetical protein